MNTYANWYDWPDDISTAKVKAVTLTDETPFDVKSHADYKKLTERFMGGLFKDKNLEMSLNGTANNNADHN